MKKSTAPCRARFSGAPQQTALGFYVKPEMEIIELEQEQYILAGSAEAPEVGDGGDGFACIPSQRNEFDCKS
mgnify:FL=1